MSTLNQMMHNIAGMITDSLGPSVTVRVKPISGKDDTVARWEVYARFYGRTTPNEPESVMLWFDGELSMGELAMAATEALKRLENK